jgi:hypothetical protein
VGETADARPEEVQFVLAWHAEEDGGLTGELRVRNTSSRRVRLAGKPGLQPVGVDGVPLDTECVVTLELVLPGYVDIDPGDEASAPVGWAGWDGPPASGEVVVQWPGGGSRVTVSGPRQPASAGPATNLWSSWFER